MPAFRPLLTSLLASALAVSVPCPSADACTRVVYRSPDHTVLTARSMDWRDEIPADLWVFPRGMERHGNVGANSLTWTSLYGSVAVSSFGIATTDGMNERGLVGNMLWLVESTYPEFDGSRPGLSLAMWLQYALDRFATVEEAVAELSDEPFVVVSANIPGTSRFASVHLSLSDATGDSAIFEYLDGKLIIHHGPEHQVLTNSPPYPQQLAIRDYWAGIGGMTQLPGTNRAADRFVRASFYVQAIPQTDDPTVATASVFSVIRNTSVPFGISSEDEPNLSSTRWRVVADHKRLRYHFEDVLTPTVATVDLQRIDFGPKTPVRRLTVSDHQVPSGDVTRAFRKAEPFVFAGLP